MDKNGLSRPSMLLKGTPYIWCSDNQAQTVYFSDFTASIEMVVVKDEQGKKIRVARSELWDFVL